MNTHLLAEDLKYIIKLQLTIDPKISEQQVKNKLNIIFPIYKDNDQFINLIPKIYCVAKSEFLIETQIFENTQNILNSLTDLE